MAVCETLLNQLRSGTVACSFVQVGLLLSVSVRAAAGKRGGDESLSAVFTFRGDSSASPRPWLGSFPFPQQCRTL